MNSQRDYSQKPLKDYVFEIGTRNRISSGYPVYSVTNSDGFVASEEYFKKQVFSKDTSSYKIVPPGSFAYNPSRVNVGSIDYLRSESSVLVSPLYIVFRTSGELHPPYLKRFLLSETGLAQIDHHTQGAVRDSLKFSGLQKIEIPIPSIDEQKRIAALLDKADALRRQRQESLQLTEKLVQAVFIDMFGDPATNPKGLPMMELGGFGIVQTGNTPPRSNKANYDETGHEWIKTDNIVEDVVIATPALERLSPAGAQVARIASAGSLLVACIAGSEKSIGRAALVDREVAFNQQINAITPHADTSSLFLYYLIKIGRQQIQRAAAKGMKKMINKSTFERLRFIAPAYDDQLKFERVAKCAIKQSKDCQAQLLQLGLFFSSLQQRAFRGELDLSRLFLEEDVIAIERAADRLHRFVHDALPKTLGTKHANRAFVAPPGIELALKAQDATVESGSPLSWSADYFKYRILATLPVPFSFADIMQKVEAVFEEPPYEAIRDLIFDLLGQDGKPALLRQRFDEREEKVLNSKGEETISFVKEMVFEPAP